MPGSSRSAADAGAVEADGENSRAGRDGEVHVLLLPSWYPTPLDPVAGIFFREQAHALARGGARVGVAAPILRGVRTAGAGALAEYRWQSTFELDAGVPTYRALGWSIPRVPAANRAVWLRLARRLAAQYAARHGVPDLVHAHSALSAGLPGREIASAWGVPLVVTEHTSLYAEGRLEPHQVRPIRAAFAGAARVVAVSRALARDVTPYAGTTPVQVVPNMVDTGFFTLPAERPPPAPFRFLTVGLFDPVKGTDVLLRAFAAEFQGRPDVVLEIGGGGALEPSLRALAEALGIGSQTRFLGVLSREEVRAALWRAHAFVLPSHVETFGVVAIEAMATGLSVIATACGGPQDTVDDGATGLLVPPGDAAALAAAMRGVAAAYGAWAARAEAIRAHVERRFAREVVVGRLLALYRGVLEDRVRGA